MPSIIRASMLFFQQAYGWSETWFRLNPDSTFTATEPLIKNLVAKRIALCGNNTYINGSRLSVEGVFRDVKLVDFAGTGTFGSQGPYSGSCPPATALLDKHNGVVVGSPSAYRPLRGLPNSMVTLGGIWTPTVPWNGLYSDYKLALTQGGWGWLGMTTQYKGDVLSVAQTAGAQTVTVVLRSILATLPPPPAARVPLPNTFFNRQLMLSVSGVIGAGHVNGRHLFTTTDGVTFVSMKRMSLLPYVAGGKVLFSAKDFVADAGTGQVTRIDERKPGRPFYLSRGRRRATIES
jgi:hypothetical protein